MNFIYELIYELIHLLINAKIKNIIAEVISALELIKNWIDYSEKPFTLKRNMKKALKSCKNVKDKNHERRW